MTRTIIKAWIEAMRLRTLPVSVAGVLAGVGCAVKLNAFSPIPAGICLIFAVLAQIVSNFANEYYDWKNGLDRPGREGFRRGVTEGDLTPQAMKRAFLSLLFFDALIGLSLIYFGGWWLIFPGILIAIFAIAYSTGPWPLSHHGLGDVAVIIFFGVVPVVLTTYVQTGPVALASPLTWMVGTGVGLLAANVLIVNNYRDMEDDAAVGKHTSVVLLGRNVMAWVYLFFGGCGLLLLDMWLPEGRFILAALEAAIVTRLWLELGKHRGAALNPLLGKTAISLLAFVIIFTAMQFFFSPAKAPAVVTL